MWSATGNDVQITCTLNNHIWVRSVTYVLTAYRTAIRPVIPLRPLKNIKATTCRCNSSIGKKRCFTWKTSRGTPEDLHLWEELLSIVSVVILCQCIISYGSLGSTAKAKKCINAEHAVICVWPDTNIHNDSLYFPSHTPDMSRKLVLSNSTISSTSMNIQRLP